MTPVNQCGLARPHEVLFPLILAVFAPWTVQCHRRPEKKRKPFLVAEIYTPDDWPPEKPELPDDLLRHAPLTGHRNAKGAACLGNNTATTPVYTDKCLMPATSVTISNTTVPFTRTNHDVLRASTTTRVSIS